MLSFILLFAVEVYTILVQHTFACQVLTLKKIGKYTEPFVWGLLFFVGNFFTYVIVKDGWYNTVVLWILIVIAFKVLYIDSLRTICVTSAFLVIIGLLSEFVAIYLWMFMTGEVWNGIQSNNTNVALILISKIIVFLMVKTGLLIIRKQKNVEISFQDWVEVFLVPSGSVLFIYALFSGRNDQNGLVNIFISCILLMINISTYNLYEKTKIVTEQKIREEMLKEESLYYIRQYNDNEKIWNELRKFRHNIKEQYITQKIMLKNKEYEKLDKMYDEILNISSSKVNASNIGNIYFDSIINYKAAIAESFGIKIKLNAIIPTNSSVDVEDINLCLGNLLDNAIEALKTFDGERIIDLELKSEEDNLWICISNGCANNPVKQDGKYITTKDDSRWHGLGLSIVKDIVDKYDGDMKVDETDGKFTVSLLMYEFLK